MRICKVVFILLLVAPLNAMAQDHFISKLKLITGQTLVVEEGNFEARSIGSFSVRLYAAAEASDETTFFVAGLIRARDGIIEKAILADIDGDKQQELVVVVRSVGTGSYQSAHAFAISKNNLIFLAEIENLAPDFDPVAALRNSKVK